MNRHAGYTLIEAIVCVFMIALLTGVLLTSLRAVRGNMTNTSDLLNLGLTTKDFFAYASDHEGRLPNAGLPSEADSAPWFYGGSPDAASRASQYLMHTSYWPVVLFNWSGQANRHWHGSSGPAWSPGSEHMQYEWDDASPKRQAWMPSAFGYGSCLWTAAEVWEAPGLRLANPSEFEPYFRKQFLSSLASPAQKGILLYRASPRSDTHWQTAFGDGHVSEHARDEYRPAATMPMSYSPEPGIPVYHTLDGVRGRDI